MSDNEQVRQSWVRRLLSNKRSGWVVAAALACAVVVLSVVLATSPAATSGNPGPGGPPAAAGGGAANARSGPAEGGAVGTVDSVSSSGFTMSTPAGQKVTVDEASASDITDGENVLVLGMTDGTTITATQVIAQANDGSSASSAAGVVPFQRGAPATSKQVGQIPDYTEGDGTIVSGTTADKATEAALAAYPGGVVDRVVQLSGGEYEVHNVGVNWPHHVFVDQDFTVVGAQ